MRTNNSFVPPLGLSVSSVDGRACMAAVPPWEEETPQQCRWSRIQ